MFHDKELKAWRENKDALHAELDAAGVPKFEEEDCRIAARVRWVLDLVIPNPPSPGWVEIPRQHAEGWHLVYRLLTDAGMREWSTKNKFHGNGYELVKQFIRYLSQEVQRLRAAVTEHHAQKADDRCWEDDDRLYAAFGLPPVDRSIGDPTAMLENCKRFIKQRCEGGGPWKSYAELEAEVERLKEENETLRRMQFAPSGDNHHNALACPYCSGSDDTLIEELERRGYKVVDTHDGYDD